MWLPPAGESYRSARLPASHLAACLRLPACLRRPACLPPPQFSHSLVHCSWPMASDTASDGPRRKKRASERSCVVAMSETVGCTLSPGLGRSFRSLPPRSCQLGPLFIWVLRACPSAVATRLHLWRRPLLVDTVSCGVPSEG